MNHTPPLAELDVSKLSDEEKSFLDKAYHSSNIAFKAGLFMGIINFLAAYNFYSLHGMTHNILPMIILKATGYLLLGFWAKSWNVIACVILLVWHCYFTYSLMHAESIQLKLTFYIPLLLIIWGTTGAFSKAAIIKKCQN